MEVIKLKTFQTSSAHRIGVELREIIFEDGLKDSIVRHIKDIFTNHSDSKLKEFISGLTGGEK